MSAIATLPRFVFGRCVAIPTTPPNRCRDVAVGTPPKRPTTREGKQRGTKGNQRACHFANLGLTTSHQRQSGISQQPSLCSLWPLLVR